MKYSIANRPYKIAFSLILITVVCFAASACSSKTDQSAITNRPAAGNQSADNERLNETTRNSPANSVTNPTENNGQPASQPGLQPPILPDGKLTPGDALDVTKDDICVPGYSKKVRDVPQAVKEEAYKEYGITQREPGEYEVDHLVSLELGGSNSIKNLWAESYRTEPWNARVKDKLENKLHEMICNGQIDLKVAQQAIASNWIDAYKKYVGAQSGSGGGGAGGAVYENNSARNRLGSSKDTNTNRPSKANQNNSANTAGYPPPTGGAIIGNKNSHAFHLPGCPDYDKISPKNRVEFQSAKEAEAAGYHLAGNCRQK